MYVGVSGHALLVHGPDRAVGDLELGAFGATNAGVHIPYARAAIAVEVVLNELGTWRGSFGLHNHIGPLDVTTLSRLTDLDDWDRVVHV
jgi:hypothetical protein